MTTSRTYNILSTIFASAGLLILFLVLRELPNNDGANGAYINLILDLFAHDSREMHGMSALGPFSINEHRVVSLLYISTIAFSFNSIMFGLVGRLRKELSTLHAASIAISLILLIASYQIKWVYLW